MFVGVLDQILGSGKEIGEGGGRGIQLAARVLEGFYRVPLGQISFFRVFVGVLDQVLGSGKEIGEGRR